MTDRRTALFDAIRPFAPDRKFLASHVQVIDALADSFGMQRMDAQPKIPDDYWPMLAKIESGNRPYIKANTSSASGLYQFIKSTWLGEGGKWGTDATQAFGGLKPSQEEQTARARTFTEKNAAYLARQGIPINKASLYAAHFFGPQTAAKVIGADKIARADLLAGDAATQANPSILRGKTVAQFLTWLQGKTGEMAV
ncbi:hypothetical protein ACQKJZ_04555 [Sphingomonas sp. NPDC019816]|uniref:hypothetical protein n=1 Tax=Sphingomonas sp. NPDC019816 TaxID=3390679 RepID=UPI003CFD245F